MSNVTRFDPIDDLFRGFFVKPMDFPNNALANPSFKVDVKERENAYILHADLPGVKKEDIHVQIDGNLVSISSEIKQEKESNQGERVLRSERYFGKIARSFQLGHEVDEAQANARFADGVLELTLPKKRASGSRRLSIQ
jgi:HSP20 family protein